MAYRAIVVVGYEEWMSRVFEMFDATFVLGRSVVSAKEAVYESVRAYRKVGIFVQCGGYSVIDRESFDPGAILGRNAAVSVGGCNIFARWGIERAPVRLNSSPGVFAYNASRNYMQLSNFARFSAEGKLVTTHAVFYPISSPVLYNYMSDILARRTPIWNWRYSLLSCSHSPPLNNLLTSCCEPHWKRKLPNRQPRCLQDDCSQIKPECPSPPGRLLEDYGGRMASLTHSLSVQKLMATLKKLLKLSEMRVQAYSGRKIVGEVGIDRLTPGEIGYRLSFYAAVVDALRKNASFFWFDDDLLLHKNFGKEWVDIQRARECTGFLENPGGILLLGASEWSSPKVWTHISSKRRCYNAFSRTFGSFAIFVSHQVLPWIHRWLVLSSRPFDHIYTFLQQKGFVVRVAYPNLIIMNTSHVSTTDDARKIAPNRTERMRWNPADYTGDFK